MKVSAGVLAVLTLLACSGMVSGKEEEEEEEIGLHEIIRGFRKKKPSDIHLYHDSVKVGGNLLPIPTVQSDTVCYPPKSAKHSKFTITAFKVSDVGKGGYASVKKGGGIGKHKVCFRLKSQRGRGYHFDIDVWGYYKK